MSASSHEPPPGHSLSETSEVDSFASSVETLGVERFPDIFASGIVNHDGGVTVYANASSSALTAAVADVNPTAIPVTFMRSKFSHAQLDKLNQELAIHAEQLLRHGVRLNASGPQPPYDAVYVTVLQPADKDLAELSASGLVPAALIPVTPANYVDAVSAAISAAVGPNYKVHHTYGSPAYAV